MKVTSKGQVTIPQAIRERLGLLPETEVVFEVTGNAVRVRKAPGASGRGAAVVARLKGRSRSRLTTDQILALTRG
jgi:AbrB family looped-hinge helix DNA binding protein